MKLKFSKEDILTIPNMLSFFRLILIPVIVVCYWKYDNYALSVVLILISGLTDVLDGFIARKFNMVSDFGKILDPIMDKLTQAAILLCLFSRFTKMIYLFLLMSVKEIVTGITGIIGINRSGEVKGADWHGKLSTCTLYAMMIVHMLWYDIPPVASDFFVALCAGVMCLSFVLYVTRNVKQMKDGKNFLKN